MICTFQYILNHFSAKASLKGSGRTAWQTQLPITGAYLDKENHMLLLRGDIPRSQKIEDCEVFISMQLDEAQSNVVKINVGHCPCQAGIKEDCQHTAALIFNAKRIVDRQKVTVTGKKCYWTDPGTLTGDARKDVERPISEMNIYRQRESDMFKGESEVDRRCVKQSRIYKKEFPFIRTLTPSVKLMLAKNQKLLIEKGRKRQLQEKEKKYAYKKRKSLVDE